MWHGPNLKYNRPELRHYSLIIKNSTENLYLRKNGLQCLANHEISTHYVSFVTKSNLLCSFSGTDCNYLLM